MGCMRFGRTVVTLCALQLSLLQPKGIVADAQFTVTDIPGVIEAELFDEGGPGVGYNDTTPNNLGDEEVPRDTGVDLAYIKDQGGADLFVGWIFPGEWLRYTVNVSESAPRFNWKFYVVVLAFFNPGPRTLRVVTDSIDPEFPCDTFTTDLTGLVELDAPAVSLGQDRVGFRPVEWDTSMVTEDIGGLSEGEVTIWLCFESVGFNLDSFEIILPDDDTPAPTTPAPTTPAPTTPAPTTPAPTTPAPTTPAPTTPAPTTPADPICGVYGGIYNSNNMNCCADTCLENGEPRCRWDSRACVERDGGRAGCCPTNIANNAPVCGVGGAMAPCNLPVDTPAPTTPAPTTPAPTTTAPTTEAPVPEPVSECSNGFAGFEGENDNGKACCPLECTKCGGSRCGSVGAAAGLDNTACCINGVLNNQEICSATNAAPCVIDGANPTPAPVEDATPSPVPEGPVTCGGGGIQGIQGNNDNGSVCCPLACNQCGGTNCARSGKASGLTNTQCCVNGVLDSGVGLCSETSTAPCIL